MRRITLIALLVFTALLLAGCRAGEPDIEVAQSYDLGSIQKGDVAETDLVVRNVGDAPLTVVSVSTSCGCTTATVTPQTIAPGAQGRLHLAYDSAVHENDIGPIERYVFIASDDPDEGDVQVRFTVLVAEEGA